MKKKQDAIKANCIYCTHSGEVKDYMCSCAFLSYMRSTGIRACKNFKLSNTKYNEVKEENKARY